MGEVFPPRRPTSSSRMAFWRDERVIALLAQLAFLGLVVWVGYLLASNMVAALSKQGITLGFGFLRETAGFDIGETPIPYRLSDSFLRALQVGLANTLLVCVAGIVLSTALGLVIGVARLSSNYLVNRLAWLYIELMRNVPLLVLLIFCYTAVFLKLPLIRNAVTLPGPVFLSNRGVAIPWLATAETFGSYVGVLAAGLAAAAAAAAILMWRSRRAGRPGHPVLGALLVFVLVAAGGWLVLPQAPLAVTRPELRGLNFAGGLVLTPEFMALLVGLTLYTAAFIGEVVRAGIQAVPKGQIEASRALGLSGLQSLRLIVLPQALRVIIPPLTSQYLNLTKNSSLAVAIGYPDLFAISGTIINQTGRAVEMIALVASVYLMLSLLTSLLMNWYNRAVRLVER